MILFLVYAGLMKKHKFPAARIYNMDETGITTVQVPPKIIAEKGVKQVCQTTSVERGILTTCICCISGNGNSIPSTYVWPRKTNRNIETYMRGTIPGSLGLFHDSGWMTDANFDRWMGHFISHTKPSQEDPVLPLIDNHSSHLSIPAINMAKDSGVILLTFPPHTTHKLQPLDVAVYGPFKTYYNHALNNWQLSNPGKTISIYQVGELSATAITRAVNPENIRAGFNKTGLCPLNDDEFSDNDFLPSYMTDRPIAATLDQAPNSCDAQSCTLPATAAPLCSVDATNAAVATAHAAAATAQAAAANAQAATVTTQAAQNIPLPFQSITPQSKAIQLVTSTNSSLSTSRVQIFPKSKQTTPPSALRPYPKADARKQTSKGRKKDRAWC